MPCAGRMSLAQNLIYILLTSFEEAMQTSIHFFLHDERGELGPGSYLLALTIALFFIFFTIDLGLRKGAKLGVEYAAYCAARAAAVNLQNNANRSCDSTAASSAATRAAAACMAPFVSKRGYLDPTVQGAVTQLINRAQQQVTVSLQGGCLSSPASSVVTATVQYKYLLNIPMSPLSGAPNGTTMTASAQSVMY